MKSVYLNNSEVKMIKEMFILLGFDYQASYAMEVLEKDFTNYTLELRFIKGGIGTHFIGSFITLVKIPKVNSINNFEKEFHENYKHYGHFCSKKDVEKLLSLVFSETNN